MKIFFINVHTGAFANSPILYGWIYPNLLMVLMIIQTYCCVSYTYGCLIVNFYSLLSFLLSFSSFFLPTLFNAISYMSIFFSLPCFIVNFQDVFSSFMLPVLVILCLHHFSSPAGLVFLYPFYSLLSSFPPHLSFSHKDDIPSFCSTER